MSLDKIQKLVGNIARAVEDNEKLATPVLAAKLAKAIEVYPGDQTFGNVHRIIESMILNNKIFIKKAEFKDLYSKYFSRMTKFAQVFEKELGDIPQLATPTLMKHDDGFVPEYEVKDQVLAGALESIFNKTQLKTYSNLLATKALVSVGKTLDVWNLKPSTLEVNAGNEKFLIVKADYETPKGITSLYVPVEVVENKVAQSSVFVGSLGPQELNHSNIKKYLTTHAGVKSKINGDNILYVLSNAVAENREVSDVELAIVKLNATRNNSSLFGNSWSGNSIIGQKISEAAKADIELPKSDEFVSFEKQFTSVGGLATYAFGDKVKIAKSMIEREVIGFGYKNPQITVTASDKENVFFGVSLEGGKVAFTVPVKVADKVIKPTLLLCNGSVGSFDVEGINTLFVNNHCDYKVAAITSPMHGLNTGDLVNSIRDSLSAGNHIKAEDALNVLKNAGDEKAYAIGFQAYLNGLKKVASVEKLGCTMIQKNSKVSSHPICSHTGLPLHKVYQDDNGNCRPLYRRGMSETFEGAFYSTAKILG